MQLVIAEKPSVAKNIAEVLGAMEKKEGYLEGNGYLVSWCVGHLVELAQPERYGEQWKKWSYDSLPVIPKEWQYEIRENTKEQYEILERLMYEPAVDTIVCATDAGREGELIFRLVYETAGCTKPVKRLWISSMEESAIREGFAHLKEGTEYDHLYHAARCRQEADWLVGINGTRLFTVLYGGKVLKVGRVQTPTLAMLVERETNIMDFKKETYYKVQIRCHGLDASTERIDHKTEADKIAGACLNRQALVVSVGKEEVKEAPPKLYDLTTLQRDANRLFGFTAKQTLDYTQSLYEKKLCTYPRTDSRYLSEDMQMTAEQVVTAICDAFDFVPQQLQCMDVKKVLNSKKVTDHHAIIPTKEVAFTDLKEIPETERKILSLIAERLLCATGETHVFEKVKAELSCGEQIFYADGKTILKNGWKVFEDAFCISFNIGKEKEVKELSDLEEGTVLEVVTAKVTEHVTRPPKRYTEDSLLSAMERAGSEDMGIDAERKGLGTSATRADIIEKLVANGYVKREKKNLIPTDEGIRLITVVPETMRSAKLTADWENALSLVAKGTLLKEDFMDGIEEMIKEMIQMYRGIGEEQKEKFAGEKASLGICPNCGGEIFVGKYGPYCKEKCGMEFRKFKAREKGKQAEFGFGVNLNREQLESLLMGKRTLVENIPKKGGGTYAAYLTPISVVEYSYEKDGEEYQRKQYFVEMERKGGFKTYGNKREK